MRRVILAIAVSTIALAACGKEETTGNTSAVDQAVSAEDFVTNDATAIDAATGADANMAADIDINLVENQNGNDTAPSRDGAPRSRQRSSPTANEAAPEPAPAAEPAGPAAESNSN